jgi:hypothetical protein
MVINLEARHILEAHKKELQISDANVCVLDEDEGIIRKLEVGDASRYQVRNYSLNMTNPCCCHQDARESFSNKVEEQGRERIPLTHCSLVPKEGANLTIDGDSSLPTRH